MAMRKFFGVAVLVVLGVIFVGFAVGNRHLVVVSFDPYVSSDPSFGVTLPLFLVIILSGAIGVVAGGCATWFRQRRWRRAARQHEADARQARAQLADLRAATAPRGGGLPYPALPPGSSYGAGSYGSAGRDKQGATL
jgi:uncharacterized integral membrane protein